MEQWVHPMLRGRHDASSCVAPRVFGSCEAREGSDQEDERVERECLGEGCGKGCEDSD